MPGSCGQDVEIRWFVAGGVAPLAELGVLFIVDVGVDFILRTVIRTRRHRFVGVLMTTFVSYA